MLAHFGDLDADLPAMARRAAALLEMTVAPHRCIRLVERQIFDTMKRHPDAVPRGGVFRDVGAVPFFHGGPNGQRCAGTVNPEDCARYSALARGALGKVCARRLDADGSLPYAQGVAS